MADFECTNRAMSLSALETIANSLEGMKKTALLAVREWVLQNTFQMPDGYEDRKRRITELMEERRDCMTEEQRIEEARFYLDGIKVPPALRC
jgi:hypothetical protein